MVPISWVFLSVKSSEIAKDIFNLSDQVNTTDAIRLFGDVWSQKDRNEILGVSEWLT